MPKILLVTGEASGDLHGAHLARALFLLHPTVQLVGVGGQKMLEAGVRLIPDVPHVDAIGVPKMSQLILGWKTLRALIGYVQHERLDGIVLIDSPGLNLRLAKAVAKKASHTIIYYIAPQVWAWGSRRLHLMRRVITRVLAILPFEEEYFRNAGVTCNFVGHPLLDDLQPAYDKIHERQRLGLNVEGVVVGLLPGSREREVQDILPTLLRAVQLLRDHRPSFQLVLAQANSLSDRVIQQILEQSEERVHVIKGQSNEVMAASDLLLIASGTATLQAALLGIPMVMVYRVSRLTYEISKRLVTIPYIGLVNILSGKEVVPELVQYHMTPERIAQEALNILDDRHRTEMMKQAFQAIRVSLGGPGASKRAAELILAEINR